MGFAGGGDTAACCIVVVVAGVVKNFAGGGGRERREAECCFAAAAKTPQWCVVVVARALQAPKLPRSAGIPDSLTTWTAARRVAFARFASLRSVDDSEGCRMGAQRIEHRGADGHRPAAAWS